MNNKTIFEMKTKDLKNQMDELMRLREVEMIQNYRNFKSIFLDSAKSILNIGESDTVLTLGIFEFINSEILEFNKLCDKYIEKNRVNIRGLNDKDGILPTDISTKYKYCQNIITDYINFGYSYNPNNFILRVTNK